MPGGEKWSVNPCFGLTAPGVPVDFTTALAAANAAAGVTVPADLRTLNVTGVTVTDFRLEARDWDGSLESVAQVQKTPAIGGTGSAAHPYQTSLVFSLRTLNATARGKGRLYWPATGVAVDNTSLRISDTTRGIVTTAMKTYLSGIETAMKAVAGLSSLRLVVWSRSNAAGYYVDRILGGDVLDTQRRRRDALVEGISQVAYP